MLEDTGPRVIFSGGPDDIDVDGDYHYRAPVHGATARTEIAEAYAWMSSATAIMTTVRD